MDLFGTKRRREERRVQEIADRVRANQRAAEAAADARQKRENRKITQQTQSRSLSDDEMYTSGAAFVATDYAYGSDSDGSDSSSTYDSSGSDSSYSGGSDSGSFDSGSY